MTFQYFKAGLAAICLSLTFSSAAFAQTMPVGWNSADVGAVGAAGSASGDGISFSVTGAGADIWNSADAFRFVYKTLSGDGSIVTRVATEQYVAAWTKAGVMIRESLDPGSRHAMMIVSPGKGLAFQRRVATGGVSTSTPGSMGTAPAFVRLTRAGATLTAAQSSDGVNWVVVGTDTINMSATVYVGLIVSSHVYGTLATATFESTAVTATPTTPPATTTKTLVFFRHGEKPSGGYGQLTCQGLQRALALPPVLTTRYGSAHYVFAPNPAVMMTDAAGSFYYVRPLATVEPTAIRLGLPVNVRYGYNDLAGIEGELTGSPYASSTVFIAWEHQYLVTIVQDIMNKYHSGVTVPAWTSGDYDSLYVVRLTDTGGTITAQFTQEYEGLNNLSTSCQ